MSDPTTATDPTSETATLATAADFYPEIQRTLERLNTLIDGERSAARQYLIQALRVQPLDIGIVPTPPHAGADQRIITACAYRCWQYAFVTYGGSITDPLASHRAGDHLLEFFARLWFEHEFAFFLDGSYTNAPAYMGHTLKQSGVASEDWVQQLIQRVDLDQSEQRRIGRKSKNPSLAREACIRAFTAG